MKTVNIEDSPFCAHNPISMQFSAFAGVNLQETLGPVNVLSYHTSLEAEKGNLSENVEFVNKFPLVSHVPSYQQSAIRDQRSATSNQQSTTSNQQVPLDT